MPIFKVPNLSRKKAKKEDSSTYVPYDPDELGPSEVSGFTVPESKTQKRPPPDKKNKAGPSTSGPPPSKEKSRKGWPTCNCCGKSIPPTFINVFAKDWKKCRKCTQPTCKACLVGKGLTSCHECSIKLRFNLKPEELLQLERQVLIDALVSLHVSEIKLGPCSKVQLVEYLLMRLKVPGGPLTAAPQVVDSPPKTMVQYSSIADIQEEFEIYDLSDQQLKYMLRRHSAYNKAHTKAQMRYQVQSLWEERQKAKGHQDWLNEDVGIRDEQRRKPATSPSRQESQPDPNARQSWRKSIIKTVVGTSEKVDLRAVPNEESIRELNTEQLRAILKDSHVTFKRMSTRKELVEEVIRLWRITAVGWSEGQGALREQPKSILKKEDRAEPEVRRPGTSYEEPPPSPPLPAKKEVQYVSLTDIHSEDEIRNLRIKQLKAILKKREISTKWATERGQLVEEVIRIWNYSSIDAGTSGQTGQGDHQNEKENGRRTPTDYVRIEEIKPTISRAQENQYQQQTSAIFDPNVDNRQFTAGQYVSLEDIHTADEIEKLRIRQLKNILKKRSIQTKHFTEKSQMVVAVVHLWTTARLRQKEGFDQTKTTTLFTEYDCLESIPNTSVIPTLKIKQLKAILKQRSYQTKHYTEKSQLIEAVTQLWMNEFDAPQQPNGGNYYTIADIPSAAFIDTIEEAQLRDILIAHQRPPEDGASVFHLRHAVLRLWNDAKEQSAYNVGAFAGQPVNLSLRDISSPDDIKEMSEQQLIHVLRCHDAYREGVILGKQDLIFDVLRLWNDKTQDNRMMVTRQPSLQDITVVGIIRKMDQAQLTAILRKYNIDASALRDRSEYEDVVTQLWLKRNKRDDPIDDGLPPKMKPPHRSVSLSDIVSFEDIDHLAIAQLKDILKKHKIDPWLYNEKGELVHMVRNLWSENRRNTGADKTSSLSRQVSRQQQPRDPKVLSLKDLPSATAIAKLSTSQLKAIVHKYSPHLDNQFVEREQLVNEVIVMWSNKTPSLCDINLIDDVYKLDNDAMKEILRKHNIDPTPYKEKAQLRFVVARLWYTKQVKATGSIKSLNVNEDDNTRIRSPCSSPLTISSYDALSMQPNRDSLQFSPAVLPPGDQRPLSLHDITSVEDIRGLHERLMRAILNFHSVDTRHISDKEELRAKLTQLWQASRAKSATQVNQTTTNTPILTTVEQYYQPHPIAAATRTVTSPVILNGFQDIPFMDEDRSETSSINNFTRGSFAYTSSAKIDHRIRNPNASYRSLSRQLTSDSQQSHADKVKSRLLDERHDLRISVTTGLGMPAAAAAAAAPSSEVSLASIRSEEECHRLSIAQTKQLLQQHSINFANCTERRDLSNLLVRLWRDLQSRGQGIGNQNGGTCTYCMVRPIDCVFLDCGHMITCLDCGSLLKNCPNCDEHVKRAVRAYTA